MPTKTVSSQRTTSSSSRSTSRTAQLTSAQREEVARIAYQLWLDGGCQHGRDQQDWAKAETIVRSKLS